MIERLIPRLKLKNCLMIALGNLILAFGLYNIHEPARITEGGVLGMTLLLKHWFNISPGYSGFVINALCFIFGWRVLGKDFLGYSAVAAIACSLGYLFFERFDPLWPELYRYPALAALLGAIFIGVGAGLSVRAGGASGGDDALAMSLSRITRLEIQWLYLIFDLIVLAFSLTYIPLPKILWSLVTVVLSGQIIGWIQKLSTCRPKEKSGA